MFFESHSFNLFFWGVCENKFLKSDFVYFEEQKKQKNAVCLEGHWDKFLGPLFRVHGPISAILLFTFHYNEQ